MVQKKQDYNIMIKKDGKFYTGYCLEIPQARGQGDTKAEAIEDTKKSNQTLQVILAKKDERII